jgi:predicted small secreted protein
MWYVIAVFIVLAGILLGCNTKSKAEKDIESNTQNLTYHPIPDNPTDTIKPMYSIKDIKKKLKKLAESEPPKELAFGAMCYEMVAPPKTANYVCPVCQQKTLYKLEDNDGDYQVIELVRWEIATCREEMKKVEGINIKLDESQFCKNCSPDVKKPQLCLEINITNGGKTHKVYKFSYLDIRLIGEFLNGELKHTGSNDGETPMKDYMKRLQELLGVKL